jgi:hypothetical protein
MSRASTPGHTISSAFSGGTSGISKAMMDSRFVVGQTCPKHRALLEAPLQDGYTLDNAIEPCLPSRAAADHQRAVGVFSAFRRPSQAALPSSCRNAGTFSSRPPEHDPPSSGGALIKQSSNPLARAAGATIGDKSRLPRSERLEWYLLSTSVFARSVSLEC